MLGKGAGRTVSGSGRDGDSVSREGAVARTFVELADTLVEGYDLIDFLYLLTDRCVSLLAVAEGGVVLGDLDGSLRTMAASSERMRLVELIELQSREGPSLDCFRDGAATLEHDLAATTRWPVFTAAAADAGFRSVYALPLRLRTEAVGALNLFAEEPHALDEDDLQLGQALADVATIGILHARVLHERELLAEQLQVALDSRVALEQAKGVVAEQAGLDVDAAFHLLRGYARHNNRYIGDVVGAVLRHQLSAADLRASSRKGRTGVG